MIRSFRKPPNKNSTTSFGTNLKFYTIGAGRGGSGTVEFGGKTYALNERFRKNAPIIQANPSPKEFRNGPGQFDEIDELEERRHLETLSNSMRDPQELERQRYRLQQQRDNGGGGGGGRGGRGIGRGGGMVRGVGRGRGMGRGGGRGGTEGSRFDNARENRRRTNFTDGRNIEKLKVKDFVSEDIDWYDFTLSQMKDRSLNIQDDDEETLKLESMGGDYERYVTVPDSIKEQEPIMDQLAAIKNIVGQNAAYKLSDKKLFYETIAKTLKLGT